MERKTLEHLILDPSWFRFDIGSPGKGLPNILEKSTSDDLEKIGRIFCYQVYKRRLSILTETEATDSETDTDDDSYSLHDTTEEDSIETDDYI